MSESEKKELSSMLKRALGVGGAVKEGNVEIQGDKVEEVVRVLGSIGIKAS
jgi:translation initiation factor 1